VTAGLERLIELAGQWDVPAVLAVIPDAAEPDLAVRLASWPMSGSRSTALPIATTRRGGKETGAWQPQAGSDGAGRAQRRTRQAGDAVWPPSRADAGAAVEPHRARTRASPAAAGPALSFDLRPGSAAPSRCRDCCRSIANSTSSTGAPAAHPHAVLAGRLAALVRERAVTAAPARSAFSPITSTTTRRHGNSSKSCSA
jgi:hypothetical protein